MYKNAAQVVRPTGRQSSSQALPPNLEPPLAAFAPGTTGDRPGETSGFCVIR
jgi:hypothetical protein